MNCFSCKICFKPFTITTPPRIFPCGHTSCSPCLSKCLETTKLCYKCSTLLTESRIREYSVNYNLLNASHELTAKNSAYTFYCWKKRLRIFFDKGTQVLAFAKSSNTGQLPTGALLLKAMRYNASIITRVSLLPKGHPELMHADKLLDYCEKQMTGVAAYLAFESKYDYNLRLFKDCKDFLKRIHMKVEKNEKIFAHKIFKGVDHLAVIHIIKGNYASSIEQRNKLFIRAFNSTPKEPSAKLVQFTDLQHVFKNNSMGFYLKFSSGSAIGRTLYLDFFPGSSGTFFIREICIGENGRSFIGCHYEKQTKKYDEEHDQTEDSDDCDDLDRKTDSCLEAESRAYHKITVDLCDRIEFDFKYLKQLQKQSNIRITANYQDYYAKLTPSGDLEISQSTREGVIFLGKVINAKEIENIIKENGQTVTDCGMSVKL